MRPSSLFVVNGLGMGNSTRCGAVMEHLADAGVDIHVLTSGNGVSFFRDKPYVKSISAAEPFFYGGQDGGVNGWDTVKSLSKLLKIARNKARKVEEVVERVRPNVAVIDSEYTIGPLRKRKIPVVGLNTSEIVVSEYLQTKRTPREVRSHFWCVEFFDYLFHKHLTKTVLSPFPVPTRARTRRFRRIGLIVRRGVLECARQPEEAPFIKPRELRRVVFMLSGSIHASEIDFSSREFPFDIDIVGRPGPSRGRVTFHGRQLNNIELLRGADALVINGGYSAVSEAFALGKPAFIIPVRGHAEQFVNAALVERLGVGFVATQENVLDQLMKAHQRNEWPTNNQRPARFNLNGAEEAAAIIASHIPSFRTFITEPALPVVV